MPELSDRLQNRTPMVLAFPDETPVPADPIPWALEMFAASLFEADMQSRPGSENRDTEIIYFDQKDPASLERFRAGIENAEPIHGSLALIDICAGDGTVRDNADWAWQVYNAQFSAALTSIHSMGVT